MLLFSYFLNSLMTKKTNESHKIVNVGTDAQGVPIRFIIDSKGTATRIDPVTDATVEKKSALTGMAKFLAYCQKEKLVMAEYRINKIVFCRCIKGNMVPKTMTYPEFMREHNLGTLKIGSGIAFQNASLNYSLEEISDLKTFANVHIAEKFRV